MPSILFVHGTGTRELDYAPTLRRVQQRLPQFHVLPCLWGDSVGARLRCGGASIPEYAEQAAGPGPDEAKVTLARWDLLYQDPLFELRLLEERQGERENLPPSMSQLGERAVEQARSMTPPSAFIALLEELGVAGLWPGARAEVIGDPAFTDILIKANVDPLDTTRSISRALVVPYLGGLRTAGILLFRRRHAIRWRKCWWSPWAVSRPGCSSGGWACWRLTPRANSSVRGAEFLTITAPRSRTSCHYQARGQAIRDYIRRRIQEACKGSRRAYRAAVPLIGRSGGSGFAGGTAHA